MCIVATEKHLIVHTHGLLIMNNGLLLELMENKSLSLKPTIKMLTLGLKFVLQVYLMILEKYH